MPFKGPPTVQEAAQSLRNKVNEFPLHPEDVTQSHITVLFASACQLLGALEREGHLDG